MDITLRSITKKYPNFRLCSLMLSWGSDIRRISYEIFIEDGLITLRDSNINLETTKLLSNEEKKQIRDFIYEYLYEEGVKNGQKADRDSSTT